MSLQRTKRPEKTMKPEKPIHERIKDLCIKFALSDEVREAITKLSKDSYIQGSNDNFNAMNP